MKDWEELLIWLFFEVCEMYDNDLVCYAQRFSANAAAQNTGFFDEEAMTIML